MTTQDVIVFLRDQATLEDLKAIREVFSWRLRRLQSEGAKQFRPGEPVLFVEGSVEQPATVVRVGRRFVAICLGNQHHVRCDASFLKKIRASGALHREQSSASA
jgi:hypothetical protein